MAEELNPPRYLFKKIMGRIHKEERFLVMRHAMIFSTTLLVSAAAFVPVLNMLVSDFSKTGFLRFSSLIFSDSAIIATYWQSFIMILLQTLPAASLAIFLAIIAVFLQSIRSLYKDIKLIKNNYLITVR